MNILALSEKIEATILTKEADTAREVSSGYTCDLLSWVMAHGREGMAWITVQTHMNVIAVATLHDMACVIIPEGIKVENDVIVDVKFKTYGCGAAIATSSRATEMVMGKTIDEALQITNQMVTESLGGLPPVKLHCSVLAEEALHAAIADYKAKQEAGEA